MISPNPFLPHSNIEHKDIFAIIGSGIAAQTMAFQLKQNGLTPVIIEKNSKVAQEASGNPIALIHPRLTAGPSINNDFFIDAFTYAQNFYDSLGPSIWQSRGLLRLMPQSQQTKFQKLLDYAPLPSKALYGVSQKEAQHIAGIPLPTQALYLPRAGSVRPPSILKYLLKDVPIRTQQKVAFLKRTDNLWSLRDENHQEIIKAKGVILCAGMGCKIFDNDNAWPLRPVSGQIEKIPTTPFLKPLACPIAFDFYITPSQGGYHVAGASFHKGQAHPGYCLEDQKEIFAAMKAIDKNLRCPDDTAFRFTIQSTRRQIITGRASVRATSLDHMPFAGPIVGAKAFCNLIERPIWRRPHWPNIQNHNHLYLFTGLGSHGFLTAPLLSKFILCEILGTPSPLNETLRAKLHPLRFIMKQVEQGHIKKFL